MLTLVANMTNSLLVEVTIFLGTAIVIIPLAKRFGIATVLGYLFTGLLLGPSFLKITQNQSFSDYLWAMSPNGLAKNPLINHPTDISQIPATTEFSDKMAKQLKKDGFKFLGSTTCYAFMQSCGMVNDHVADCDFR